MVNFTLSNPRHLVKPGTLGSWNLFLQSIPIRYRCDVVDADVGIGYPIASVVDVSIRIESNRIGFDRSPSVPGLHLVHAANLTIVSVMHRLTKIFADAQVPSVTRLSQAYIFCIKSYLLQSSRSALIDKWLVNRYIDKPGPWQHGYLS
jgi:hypothetical protein